MRGLIGELVSAQHQVTVVDMEAGLEHFSRSGGTLRYVDQLLIVTEMDHKALETARRTHRLATDLGIEHIGLIGNKLRDAQEEQDLQAFCAEHGIALIAAIPYDEAARQADRRGVSLYEYDPNAVTVRGLEGVMRQLEQQFTLLPARAPVVPDAAPLSAAQMNKRFPECN